MAASEVKKDATVVNEKACVLVICNVLGQFRKVFAKINKAVSKAHNLDVFIIGQFLSDDLTVTQAIVDHIAEESNKLSCPVNLFLSEKEMSQLEPFKCQLDQKLFISSGLNWLKTASGVSVVYWTDEINNTNESKTSTLLNESLTRLSNSKCDVLLTASFPEGVFNFTNKPFQDLSFASLQVSKLAKSVCPRYHFCPNPQGIYHQRHPYRNDNVLTQKRSHHHTRFITLSSCDNDSNVGAKWLYMFSTDLNKLETCDIVTECPYTVDMFKEKLHVQSSERVVSSQNSNASFRWSSSNSADDSFNENSGPNNKRRKSNKNDSSALPRECWFCLKSEACEKHLVVYVNDNTTFYVTLAKGAIHPNHLLIVPVDHHKSAAVLPDDLEQDLDILKTQVFKFYKKENLGCVMFERSSSQMHFVLQIVPISLKLVKSVIPSFFAHANKVNGVSIESIKTPNTLKTTWETNGRCNYFYVEFPTGEEFFIPLRFSHFPINFGREFLCDPSVLNCPTSADWRSCVLTKAEEEQNRDNVKDEFTQFLADD